MPDESYFQSALSNFTREMAYGGSIRHLTDQGYTVKQISEHLSFPAPMEQIRRQVWKRLLDTEVILTDVPGGNTEKTEYVQEYNKNGRVSFRKVSKKIPQETIIHWQVSEINYGTDVLGTRKLSNIRNLLKHKISDNGETCSYTSCEFGILKVHDPERYYKMLHTLDNDQKEYIEGLPWENRRVYHRLNLRMAEILLQIAATGLWQGDCYFLKTKEQLIIASESLSADKI